MASQPDLIERLWSEVINVDPAGKWMEPTGNETLPRDDFEVRRELQSQPQIIMGVPNKPT